ncbi:MAG: hypothetical protein ACI32E_02210 [Bacilli bacterium]
MHKFSLAIYKKSQIYFEIFDIYFKEKGDNKEALLKSIFINPSSYRKCRKGELKIGSKIIFELSSHYDLKHPQEKLIDELEVFLNRIYFNMYYKIYTTYEDDIKYVEQLISANYDIFPVLYLIKLFLCASSNEGVNRIKEKYLDLYQQVKKYDSIFKNELFELYEVLFLFFEDNLPQESKIKKYENPLAYYVLATKSYFNRNYVECLFYGDKAKELLDKDGNICRTMYLNNTIMATLLYVQEYEECYTISSKQLLALESMGITSGPLVKACKTFKAVSLLGKKDYLELIEMYKDNNHLFLNEITCMLIALYMKDDKQTIHQDYEKFYDDLDVDNLPKRYSIFIKGVDQALKHKVSPKDIISDFKKYEVMEQIEIIFKKVVLAK